MESLPVSIQTEFEVNGHWVVHKIAKRFSAMPIDQAHEQNNKIVKLAGGAIGLTENPSAFRKWMVSKSEQALLLKEFKHEYFSNLSDVESGVFIMRRAFLHKKFKEQAVSLVLYFQ